MHCQTCSRHLENTENEDVLCKSIRIPSFPCETRFGSMIITCRELAGRMTALSQTAVEEFILDKYGSNEAVRVRLRQCMSVELQGVTACRYV